MTFKSNEFLPTIYKIENLAKIHDFDRAFSIHEYIIVMGKKMNEDNSVHNWFSLYNTQKEIRFEVFYKRIQNDDLVIVGLDKWSDDENISFTNAQINTADGLRVLNEVKVVIEKVAEFVKD